MSGTGVPLWLTIMLMWSCGCVGFFTAALMRASHECSDLT